MTGFRLVWLGWVQYGLLAVQQVGIRYSWVQAGVT